MTIYINSLHCYFFFFEGLCDSQANVQARGRSHGCIYLMFDILTCICISNSCLLHMKWLMPHSCTTSCVLRLCSLAGYALAPIYITSLSYFNTFLRSKLQWSTEPIARNAVQCILHLGGECAGLHVHESKFDCSTGFNIEKFYRAFALHLR